MAVDVHCEEGMCRPRKVNFYQDTCKEICGYSSCQDALKEVPACDITKTYGSSKHVMSETSSSVLVCLNGKLKFLFIKNY